MRTWKRLGFTAVSVTTGLALVGAAYAAPGKKNSWARHEAELAPGATSPEPAADGTARHEAKTHKGALQLHRLSRSRTRGCVTRGPGPSSPFRVLTSES